jgi:hypothetical protein
VLGRQAGRQYSAVEICMGAGEHAQGATGGGVASKRRAASWKLAGRHVVSTAHPCIINKKIRGCGQAIGQADSWAGRQARWATSACWRVKSVGRLVLLIHCSNRL